MKTKALKKKTNISAGLSSVIKKTKGYLPSSFVNKYVARKNIANITNTVLV